MITSVAPQNVLNAHVGLILLKFCRHICYAVIILFMLTRCSTTRFEPSTPCATRVQAGSKVLLVSLPDEDQRFLSSQIRSILRKRNVSVDYLPEQEWLLKANGVSSLKDSTDLIKLTSLGYSHILTLHEISARQENAFAYFTSLERSLENTYGAYKPTENERGNRSKVIVELIPVDDVKAAHKTIVETTITHLTIRHRDQSETYINPTKARDSRNTAFLKGVKRLLEDCYR